MKKIYDDLRHEYDFSEMKGAVRGKYAQRYQEGTNIVHLDVDVAKVFKSEESVNNALRTLIHISNDLVLSSK